MQEKNRKLPLHSGTKNRGRLDLSGAFKLFLEGKSIREIQKITGLNKNTLWDAIHKQDWQNERNKARQRIVENLISDYCLSKLETLRRLNNIQLIAYERFTTAKAKELDAIQSAKLYIQILELIKNDPDLIKFTEPETREFPFSESQKENEGHNKLMARIDELIEFQKSRADGNEKTEVSEGLYNNHKTL